MTPARPRRQRFDRLTFPAVSPTDLAVDHAIAPFDRAVGVADRAWGIDVLPTLVSPETAARYGSALAKLNAALDSGNAEETAKRAGVCIRGLAVMHAEAEATNAPKAHPAVHVVECDGEHIGFLLDDDQWPAVRAAHPELRLLTSRQIAQLALALWQDAPHLPALPQLHTPARKPPNRQEIDDAVPF